jgi:hypothetical protein
MYMENPGEFIADNHSMLCSPCSHVGFLICYVSASDGTSITALGIYHIPTSKEISFTSFGRSHSEPA